MGLAAQLRQALLDAQDYADKWADYDKKKADAAAKPDERKAGPSPLKHDLKLEALLPYLQGKKPIVLAAQEPAILETAVGLARQFKLKFCSQSHQPLAAGARLCCQLEGPSDRGADLRKPEEL